MFQIKVYFFNKINLYILLAIKYLITNPRLNYKVYSLQEKRELHTDYYIRIKIRM